MSQRDVQQVISRVAAYAEFRKLLSTNPERALKSYDLTTDEKTALKDIANSHFKLDIDAKGYIRLVS